MNYGFITVYTKKYQYDFVHANYKLNIKGGWINIYTSHTVAIVTKNKSNSCKRIVKEIVTTYYLKDIVKVVYNRGLVYGNNDTNN